MDPETILNEYVGEVNTTTTRNTIRNRLVDQLRADQANQANGPTRSYFEDTLREWQGQAGQAFAARQNDLIEASLVNNMTAEDYSRMVTFNYTYSPNGIGIADGNIRWEEPKMIEVGFVEVSGNGNNNERPIQVMTGKMRVPESGIKFFEDIQHDTIKDHLFDIAKKIITQYPKANANGVVFNLNIGSSNKWPARKPVKAVDLIKELLDEAVSDIVQSTFKLQKKLREFQYIRG